MASPICLFGASPVTGNQGVTALCYGTLAALHDRGLRQVTVFDHGAPRREQTVLRQGERIRFARATAACGRRLWSADHLFRIGLAARFGGGLNAGARLLREATACLDLSAGDSFTDLYGAARFRAIVAPKQIALRMRKPLLLLPQTYGPFSRRASAETARRILANVDQAWARDSDSHERLSRLLGPDFDPARHRLGVDMAFGLWSEPFALPAHLETWINRDHGTCDRPLIGLNISGLLYNDPGAAERFGLAGDYRSLVAQLIAALVHDTDARVLLIPHVHAPDGHPESDLAAAQDVAHRWKRSADRVTVLGGEPDARQLKWLISQLDWFCGARMHATIAALSTGVPVFGLAYSLKARGVFESCGAGNGLADLRSSSPSVVVADALAHFGARAADRAHLDSSRAAVQALWVRQSDAIAAAVTKQQHGLIT